MTDHPGAGEPALPTFLILGSAKSGTGALFHQVSQHPEVFTTKPKEPMFFAIQGTPAAFRGPGDGRVNGFAVSDPDSYRALFKDAGGARARGEASTWYLYSPEAPGRIKALVPRCRMIGLLRDPAERAYSAFLHTTKNGDEPLGDFAEALEQEEARIQSGWAPIWHYRAMGHYSFQVARYMDAFPPDQLLWIPYQDYSREPRRVLESVFRHIGADPGFVPDVSARVNVSKVSRSAGLQRLLKMPNRARSLLRRVLPEGVGGRVAKAMMRLNSHRPVPPDSAMRELREHYREDVLSLSRLIGRDLGEWLPGERPR